MNAHFITGTGTGIGKTWLTCALLRYWRDAGQGVRAFKPVLSGFDMGTAEASDAGKILAALGRPIDVAALDEIAPWRFAAPLSPDMAALREGRRVDFEGLVAWTRHITSTGFLPALIEGVGGVMAPLDDRHTVRDWIVASGLPCVLVTGSYLGSLSHTLTALEALRKAGAGSLCVPGMPLRRQVTAIVVNESPGSSVALADTLASLRCHVGDVPLVAIACGAPQTGVTELADLMG
jgi:dethiobiotin synthetase